MRTGLKTAAGRAYAAAGGLRRQHKGRLVILTFHRIRPDGEAAAGRPMRSLEVTVSDFRRMLTWMRERYRPLSLADWLEGGAPPECASFAVTFDDGWADNYEVAFPVLRELGIPATVFVSTNAVENRVPFWWQTAGLLDDEIERRKASPPEPVVGRDAVEAAAREFLTWGQIREMGASGLVRFGPHGHRHMLLDSVSREEALADLRACLELLQQRIPEWSLPLLAWPNGNVREDLGAELPAMGLQAAAGTGPGAAGAVDDTRWDLPRNNVDRRLAATPGLWPWLLLRAR
jgi:peptidoglycan/xylan/chitin deacetylase (PgdA/CDA1 family)